MAAESRNSPQAEPERPSIARIYDSYMGGGHHLAVDREATREVIDVMPELPALLRVSLAFLQRSVRYLADSGIRGFLDLGAGIPTIDNVHDIVQAADPSAGIVYVDNDPVAVQERRLLVAGNGGATVLRRDLRDVDSIMGDPEVARLLRLGTGEPIAVLMSAVLHFVPDDDEVAALLADYREAMPPGSHLMISHASYRQGSAERLNEAAERYSRTVAPMKLRSLAEVEALLKGFEPVEPGVVYCSQWRPDASARPDAAKDPLPQAAVVVRRV